MKLRFAVTSLDEAGDGVQLTSCSDAGDAFRVTSCSDAATGKHFSVKRQREGCTDEPLTFPASETPHPKKSRLSSEGLLCPVEDADSVKCDETLLTPVSKKHRVGDDHDIGALGGLSDEQPRPFASHVCTVLYNSSISMASCAGRETLHLAAPRRPRPCLPCPCLAPPPPPPPLVCTIDAHSSFLHLSLNVQSILCMGYSPRLLIASVL